MTAVYGFCAVVGGVLTLVMVFGGGDADADFSADLDADLDAGVGDGAGSLLSSILSFRTLVFALTFFGITGLILPLVGAGSAFTLVAAIVVGAFVGFVNDRLLRFVRRTSGGSGMSELSLAGVPARVTLPVADQRRGRVTVDVGGREVSLVAEPFRTGEGMFEAGASVVVVEVKNGVARVARFDLPAGGIE